MGLVLSLQVFQSVLSGTISSVHLTVMPKQPGTPMCPRFFRRADLATLNSTGVLSGVWTLRTQDTSDLRQFGTIYLVPKCLTFCVFGTLRH